MTRAPMSFRSLLAVLTLLLAGAPACSSGGGDAPATTAAPTVNLQGGSPGGLGGLDSPNGPALGGPGNGTPALGGPGTGSPGIAAPTATPPPAAQPVVLPTAAKSAVPGPSTKSTAPSFKAA